MNSDKDDGSEIMKASYNYYKPKLDNKLFLDETETLG